MRVLLHVGPGKTGTSALQSCFLENQKRLLEKGVYYPSHQIDENLISSGNFLCVFEKIDGDKRFSEQKAAKVLQQAKAKGASTLLLSSEAFAIRIEPMLKFFRQCEVVYYMRNPLETCESLYNQSVKRHNNVAPINPNRTLNLKPLERFLDTVSDAKACKLVFRFYGKSFFEGGNLLSDFCSILGVNIDQQATKSVVNTSYCFESLELKRRLNGLSNQAFQEKLDRLLQRYDGGTRDYSVIEPAKFSQLSKEVSNTLSRILASHSVENSEFIDLVAKTDQKPFKVQLVEVSDIEPLVEYVFEQNRKLFTQIINILFLTDNIHIRWGAVGIAFARVWVKNESLLSKTFNKKRHKLFKAIAESELSFALSDKLMGLADAFYLENNSEGGLEVFKQIDAKTDIEYAKNAIPLLNLAIDIQSPEFFRSEYEKCEAIILGET